MNFDQPLVVGSETPDTVVIWLHGLGADGYDFEPLVPQLMLPEQSHIQFIFPHANVQPVTLNGGAPCRSWFDIYSIREIGNEDIAGMNETDVYVRSLLQQQLDKGISSKRIFLVGFSQGAAMALYSGLRFDKPLGGIIALSGLLGGSTELATQRTEANQQTPIFMAHGTADEVLPFAMGQLSKQMLCDWGYAVAWHEYHMGHQVCPQEIKDIANFLLQ
ncbi:MAG: carboxylesterase [Coxiella sp. (in: Bacteria)]|nr:MAG: carboxylesterase [Coxiella sp. (in: g-proteobacteria)]